MFDASPYAMMLVSIGTFGLLTMANSYKHYKNGDTKKAWQRLILGFGMIIIAYIYMEALLFLTWST